MDQCQSQAAYIYWRLVKDEDAIQIIAINLRKNKKGEITLEKRNCGNCKYNKFSWMFREYICTSEDSDNKHLPTDYDECCAEWEGKDE